MGWFWLSFADPDRPAGKKFLGVCIVEGDDIIPAVQRAWDMGCNPGGEAVGGRIAVHRVPPSKLNKLISNRSAALELKQLTDPPPLI